MDSDYFKELINSYLTKNPSFKLQNKQVLELLDKFQTFKKDIEKMMM